MTKLQPMATKKAPSYPTRRAHGRTTSRGVLVRAIAVASASAAMFLAACGGDDDSIDDVRLAGEAPIATPDAHKPDKPDPYWYSWIPSFKPDLPEGPEVVRLGGIAVSPYID